MNPLYWYILYGFLGIALTGLILYQFRKKIFISNKIKFSKGLGEKLANKSEIEVQAEQKNEIRIPTQGEFNLEDPNENKYLCVHLVAKKESKPELELLKSKIIANGLDYDDGIFKKSNLTSGNGFFVINGEEPGFFSEDFSVSLITLILPLKGQKNVLKTFEEMLGLARNIATSFEMKLLDDDFNGMSEQTITNYKERATELDLQFGSYVS